MDPWSLYWQGENLQSCIAAQSESDRQQLALFWQQVAEQLETSAQVLDLACGNGIVALLLLQASPDLQISAVDQADIAPERLAGQYPELGKVNFHAGTSVTSLPFADQSCDAVVSQFGIEYANLQPSSTEVARVLRPSGMLNFLIHHQQSAIVQPAMRHLEEVSGLLRQGGLVDMAQRYCAGEIKLSALEQSGGEYLDSSAYQTSKVSGQIFSGIDHAIELLNSGGASGEGSARELVATMQTRLLADQQRLQQMRSVALDDSAISAWMDRYTALGLDMLEPEPLKIESDEGEQLIGWHLSGRKGV